MNSEKDFLCQLQKDLLEDRENEQCQADPIYYGVLDYKDMPAPDEYKDETIIYDMDSCHHMTVDEYFEEIPGEEKKN